MLLRRAFASAAAQQARQSSGVEPAQIQQKVSRLPNGLTVASVDLEGAVSQLVFAFRSGSRYQQYDEDGVAHYLRNCIGTDSDNYLGLKLLWQCAQTGANLDAKLSKDLHCVHLSVNRTQAPLALSVLGEFVQPALKPWDLVDVAQEMERDLTGQSPLDVVVEGLHKAAFRNGSLANPLLCTPFQIGSEEKGIGHKKLQQYVLSRWKSAETALVGVNIDHMLLVEYASEHCPVPDGAAKPAARSPFLGGDVRQAGPGTFAHVAVAGQGAKLADEKAVAVQAVLCALIGGDAKYTSNQNIAEPGVVQQALFKAANHNPFTLSPVNIQHADVGLVGFYLCAEGTLVYPYVKAAVQGLRELGAKPVDEEALRIAKRLVTVRTLGQAFCSADLAVQHAAQVLAKGGGPIVAPADFVRLVEQVKAEDVRKAAAMCCATLALSAYGQIHQVPYLDEI